MKNIRALSETFRHLTGDLDDQAEGLINRLRRAHEKGSAAMARGHGKIAEIERHTGDAEAIVNELDAAIGDNGGPGGPLPGSEEPSRPLTVICAKCNKVAESLRRVDDKTVEVKCHGETQWLQFFAEPAPDKPLRAFEHA